eukprot:1148873-Pelagomonas_calceolata.AAC.5
MRGAGEDCSRGCVCFGRLAKHKDRDKKMPRFDPAVQADASNEMPRQKLHQMRHPSKLHQMRHPGKLHQMRHQGKLHQMRRQGKLNQI